MYDPVENLGPRIKKIIKEMGLNQNSFSVLVGANRQNINRVINGESLPNYVLINQMLNAIPELSAEWLTRGVGPIWKDKSSPMDQPTKTSTSKKETEEWEDVTMREVVDLLSKLKRGK